VLLVAPFNLTVTYLIVVQKESFKLLQLLSFHFSSR